MSKNACVNSLLSSTSDILVLRLQSGVVAHQKLVHVLVGSVVEVDCGTGLSLEVKAVFGLSRNLKDVNLNVSSLVNWLLRCRFLLGSSGLLGVLIIIGLINDALDLEVDFPGSV